MHKLVLTWENCSQILIRQIAYVTSIKLYNQDEIIVKQNDIADNFYLICEGIVEVYQESSDFRYFDFFVK